MAKRRISEFSAKNNFCPEKSSVEYSAIKYNPLQCSLVKWERGSIIWHSHHPTYPALPSSLHYCPALPGIEMYINILHFNASKCSAVQYTELHYTTLYKPFQASHLSKYHTVEKRKKKMLGGAMRGLETDHVIWWPMRGLTKNAWVRDKARNSKTNIATLWLTRPTVKLYFVQQQQKWLKWRDRPCADLRYWG